MNRLIGGLGVLGLLALTACASNHAAPAADSTPSTTSTASPLLSAWPTDAAVDYQLGGGYPPDPGVRIVGRDNSDQPADGLYSICYVNGFQTQPGAAWPDTLLLHNATGSVVADPDWPDERILDISTAENRAAIAKVLTPTVQGCAARGYQGIEFDNLDSYSRSNGAFDVADAEVFAKVLVGLAHQSNLAAGQKNTPELGRRGRTDIGFDFAVAEECRRFDECASYTDVYGPYVIDIEYFDDLGGTVAQVCADPQLPPSSVIRDRALSPAGAAGHRVERCR